MQKVQGLIFAVFSLDYFIVISSFPYGTCSLSRHVVFSIAYTGTSKCFSLGWGVTLLFLVNVGWARVWHQDDLG